MLWSVMNLENIINGNIEDELKKCLIEIGEEKEFIVETVQIIEKSSVECIVTAPPKISVSYIAKMLKGISARRLLDQLPELKDQLYRGHLWNTSYYVETIGSKSQENIEWYLEKQKQIKR